MVNEKWSAKSVSMALAALFTLLPGRGLLGHPPPLTALMFAPIITIGVTHEGLPGVGGTYVDRREQGRRPPVVRRGLEPTQPRGRRRVRLPRRFQPGHASRISEWHRRLQAPGQLDAHRLPGPPYRHREYDRRRG